MADLLSLCLVPLALAAAALQSLQNLAKHSAAQPLTHTHTHTHTGDHACWLPALVADRRLVRG